jgi:hypothetical protein
MAVPVPASRIAIMTIAIQPPRVPRPPGHRAPRSRRGPNDMVSSCSSVTRHRRSRYSAESLI